MSYNDLHSRGRPGTLVSRQITFRRRGHKMMGDRSLLHVVAVSLLVGIGGCGGVTQFAGAQPFTIAGTPPPPPPPPVAKEEPKPPPRVELRDNKIEFKE